MLNHSKFVIHHYLLLALSFLLATFGSLKVGNKLYGQEFPINFDHLGLEEGLSNENVYCSLQDNEGFWWFATANGLNRFDGVRMELFQYEEGNPNSLSANHIKCIFEDQAGYIWIGTSGGGLNRFDKRNRSFRHYKHDDKQGSLSHDIVLSITEDLLGNIWVGTENGLNVWLPEEEHFKTFLPDNDKAGSLKAGAILSLAIDDEGRLWAGTYRGGSSLGNN